MSGSDQTAGSKTIALQLSQMRADVAQSIAQLMEDLKDPQDVIRVVLGQVQNGENPGTPNARIRKIILIIQLLNLHEAFAGLSPGEFRAVVEEAKGLIALGRISNNASPLSQLPSELDLVLSQIESRQGNHFTAAWNSQTAFALARRSPPGGLGFQALIIGLRAKRLGNLAYANDAFIKAEALGLSGLDLEKARLSRIQSLRLAGHREKSHLLSQQTADQLQLSAMGKTELEWEELCRLVMQNGDPTPMLTAIRPGGTHRYSTYILETCLWTRVVPVKKYLDRIPKADTIRRQFKDAVKKPARNSFLYECVQGLEKLYDNAHPINFRIETLGTLLASRHKLLTIDKEVLLLAAAIRWLFRHHQYSLIEFAKGEYESLSLKMTDGRRRDALGLMGDVKSNPWFYYEGALKTLEFTDQLPTGLPVGLGRNLAIARASVGIAGARISGGIRRLASSHYETKEEINQREAEKIAQIIVRELGSLRGPLIKIGQVAALVMQGLPPAIQRALEQMHDSMPPMHPSKIKQVLKANFPGQNGMPFAEFDEHPIAAASIGQIHKVKLFTGEDAAVKIQYPGIVEAMQKDLRAIRLLRPFYKVIFPSADIEAVIDDTEKSFLLECDYMAEAKFQDRARAFLSDQPEVYVPKIYHEITTHKVLTMEYISGLKFYEFLHSAEESEISAACSTIYRQMLRCFLIGGIYNGDPHPGNYLIMPDGRVCFLDYGFSFDSTLERRRAWVALIESVLGHEFDQFRAGLLGVDFITNEEKFDFKFAFNNAKTFLLGEGPANDRTLESYQQVMSKMSVSSKNRKYITLNKQDMAIPRLFLSLYGFIAKSGAFVDFRAELERVIEEFHQRDQNKLNPASA